MKITHQHGDRRGDQTLLMLQGVIALVLGALLLSALHGTLYLVLVYLGAFWLLRALSFVGLASTNPRRWEPLGAAAILTFIPALLILQAPLSGATFFSGAVAVFVALQALLVGALEIILGFIDRSAPQVLQGWLNLSIGGLLLAIPLIGLAILTPTLAICALIAGALTIYLASQNYLHQPH